MQNANTSVIWPVNKVEVDFIMTNKAKIKVVKKTEAVTFRSKKRKVASSRAAAREMVSNVTGWVSDLKQRKTEETKAAFEMLFAANHRPNES